MEGCFEKGVEPLFEGKHLEEKSGGGEFPRRTLDSGPCVLAAVPCHGSERLACGVQRVPIRREEERSQRHSVLGGWGDGWREDG